MADVIVALLAILIGAAFCFRGYLAMRVIIPIWGAFAGFVFGAGLVASFADEGLLASALGWIVAFLVALLFGALAYLYYELSVLIAMAAIGFSLGTTFMIALGVEWSWLVILSGVVVGVLLALAAILADLPMALLTVLTALAGATVIMWGLLLLARAVSLGDLTPEATVAAIEGGWWWYAIYIALVVAGIIAQIRAADRVRGSLRDSWTASGGRQMRAV